MWLSHPTKTITLNHIQSKRHKLRANMTGTFKPVVKVKISYPMMVKFNKPVIVTLYNIAIIKHCTLDQ